MQSPTVEAQPRIDKRGSRVRIERGLWMRDGRYIAGYTDPSTGRWHTRTLSAKTLTEARKEHRGLGVKVDRGEAVAPSRITVLEVVEAFLAEFEAQVTAGEKAPRTLESYRYHLQARICGTAEEPRGLGRREIQKLTTDHVAQLIAEWRKLGLSARTIHGTLVALGRVCGYAVRRGVISENPVRRLERGERPKISRNDQRVLSHDEIAALLEASSPPARPLIATACYTGLRDGELRGLKWADMDFERGFVQVRKQLGRGNPATLMSVKSDAGRRDVVLMPQLAALLKRRKLASHHSADDDFVFTKVDGQPLDHRTTSRWISAAAGRAGLEGVSMHSCRHGFASYLIVELGLDVVQVSRQLGHASPTITLGIYAHLFDKARHAEDIRARMASSEFGAVLDRAK